MDRAMDRAMDVEAPEEDHSAPAPEIPASLRSAVESVQSHLKKFDARSSSAEEYVPKATFQSAGEPVADRMRRFYLILHDVSKKNNWGTLVRSASAFGCSGVVVQAKRRSDVSTFGAHGADKHVPFHFVPVGDDMFNYARSALKCTILGVEIKHEACSVNSSEFVSLCQSNDNIAVVLGNEGTGMHPNVAAKCDKFVYIPHYGAGTASLNVAVAGSIIFHRIGSNWGLEERDRVGEKFVVEELDIEKRKTMNVNAGSGRRAAADSKSSNQSVESALDILDG